MPRSKHKENPIFTNLEQQFLAFNQWGELPEELKEEVFESLYNYQFFGEISDLFTGKFLELEAIFLAFLRESEE